MPLRRRRSRPAPILVCARTSFPLASHPFLTDSTLVSSSQASTASKFSGEDSVPVRHPHSESPSDSPWWSPFGFLRNGTRSLKHGSSPALGNSKNPALFPPRQADGGLLKDLPQTKRLDTVHEDDSQSSEVRSPSQSTVKHSSPAWKSWRNWKKVTLDAYLRVTDKPLYTRFRLKQTVALLPVVKLKPVIDLGYRGPDKPPFAMHLDIKLLDCIKYRVRPNGNALLQVRARAPLSDPRFCMDVLYERDLPTSLESVKISFRLLDVAFMKAPGFGAGVKYPIRFDNGIKTTLRVKKYIVDHKQTRGHGGKRQRPLATATTRGASTQSVTPLQNQMDRLRQRYRIEGPMGFDIKFRCLEYR